MTRCALACLLALVACAGEHEAAEAPAVALHRLNRFEYDRTVRDLLGTERSPARELPADDISHGFDNISDVLALSPLLLELYRDAARVLAQDLAGAPNTHRIEAQNLSGPNGAAFHDRGWRLAEGEVTIPFEPAAPGKYRLNIAATPLHAGEESPLAAIHLDDRPLIQRSVSTEHDRLEVELVVTSTTTPGRLSVALLNPYREGANVRSLILEWIRIEGPLAATSAPAAAIFSCRPDANINFATCAQTILEPFIRRAYRRPLHSGELDAILAVAQLAWTEGERFEAAIARAIETTLMSLHFLFRIEPTADQPGMRLDDHALAARLSYFLWSSMPDETLSAHADAGRLQDDNILTAEISRMLDDPRSNALVDNFAAQWLHARDIAAATPSPTLFPEFDDTLRAAFTTELAQFFAAFLREDRPIEDLLLADFTFADPQLARFYGLEPPATNEFTRIILPEHSPRRGLLGKAAFQLVTSHSNRTSIPRRGKWVLSELLCSAPPPPPPIVPQLPDPEQQPGTLRERVEAHRNNPACAGCHVMMDPIGFGLENFDAIGRWRELDQGVPIDASGELPGGVRFEGPQQLSAILAARPELRRCVAQKLFTYALGRGPTALDDIELDAITVRYSAAGARMKDLIRELVLSETFRSRKVSR